MWFFRVFFYKGLFHNDLNFCPVALCSQLPIRILDQRTSLMEPFFIILLSMLWHAQSWTCQQILTCAFNMTHCWILKGLLSHKNEILPGKKEKKLLNVFSLWNSELNGCSVVAPQCLITRKQALKLFPFPLRYHTFILVRATKEFQRVCISLN